MRLPGRLQLALAKRGLNLTRLAVRNKTHKGDLSDVLTGKRNTPRLISILETNTGLPITTIRSIYREDKNRKLSHKELNLFFANQGASNATIHN